MNTLVISIVLLVLLALLLFLWMRKTQAYNRQLEAKYLDLLKGCFEGSPAESARLLRAAALVEQGRVDRAEALLDELSGKAQGKKERSAVLYFQAACLDAQGKSAQALKLYRKSLENSEGFWAAYLNLAVNLSELGRIKESLEAFERALERWPHQPELKLDYALTLIRARQAEQALSALNALAQEAPDYPDLPGAMAACYAAMGQSAQSEEWIQKGIKAGQNEQELRGEVRGFLSGSGSREA